VLGFWGSVLKAGDSSTITPTENRCLRLSSVALDLPSQKKKDATASLAIHDEEKGMDFILCTLNSTTLHYHLDIFLIGATTFKVIGNATLHLTGYTTVFDGDEDEYDMGSPGGGLSDSEDDEGGVPSSMMNELDEDDEDSEDQFSQSALKAQPGFIKSGGGKQAKPPKSAVAQQKPAAAQQKPGSKKTEQKPDGQQKPKSTPQPKTIPQQKTTPQAKPVKTEKPGQQKPSPTPSGGSKRKQPDSAKSTPEQAGKKNQK